MDSKAYTAIPPDDETQIALPVNRNPRKQRAIRFKFRWPVTITDPDGSPRSPASNEVTMMVPLGGDTPIVYPKFADMVKMSDAQLEKIENFALRTVALIED